MYRITADTMGIQTLTMNGLFAILSASVLLGGMLIVMFWVDWYLTLLALAVCPALFCAIALLNKKMSLAATEAHQKGSTVYSVVQRTLSGMRVIQAFTKEKDEGRRFLQSSTEILAAELRLYNLQNFYYAVVNLTIAAGTATILWVGTRHVLAGDLSVGEMIVFTSYLASLYAPINSIFQTYGLVQSAKAGVRRAFEILESEERLPDGSMEEIVSAAQVAQVHEFVERLPQKYETVVSEQGSTLSEGQKLRLTIARGILLNAPILILDEPTSSVDSETEALIMEGLEQLMAGRTTFIIAHRLSTVRQADLILVLRDGYIVEQGTFNELLRRRGPFASLYRTQFGLRDQERNLRRVK